MRHNSRAYRLNRFEIDAIKRLCSLYNKKTSIDRIPEIYYEDFFEFDKIDDTDKEKPDISIFSNFDFLGEYIYKERREGEIHLYRNRIDQSAEYFSNLLGINFEEIRDLIKFIVLMHQLGHWFSHRICLDWSQDIYSELSVNLRESLAQLNVAWSLHGLTSEYAILMRRVFFEMVRRQPFPYTDFRFSDTAYGHLRNGKSFRNRLTLINRFINICKHQMIFNDFWYFLTGDKSCEGHTMLQLEDGEILCLGFAGNTLIFE